MITIQNGKLCIPDTDRFVGFAGDNTANEKQLVLLDRAGEGYAYTLCLRFDDDTVRTVPLNAETDGANTVLTWRITRDQLYAAGVVAAQLRIADGSGKVEHSTGDFFIVGSSVDRDEYPADSVPTDSAMSDSSTNPVGNRFIKQYVDEKTAGVVKDTLTVAGFPLSSDIDGAELAGALMSYLRRFNVIPGRTPGSAGQLGIGPNKEIYLCTAADHWVPLMTDVQFAEKMDLAEEVETEYIDDVDDGALFLHDGTLYLKKGESALALSLADDVYTKAEINAMLGDVETLLAAI